MPQASSLKPIALVSAPWPLYNRPSIQLGALKAHLNACHPDLTVHTFHLYLDLAAALGYPVYRELSQRMWLAESVYAAVLYPERSSDIQRLYEALAADKKILQGISFSSLVRTVRKTTEQFMDRVKWRSFGVIGFSISLSQLAASLYLIRRIKPKHPTIPILIGGASVPGAGAHDLLKAIPEIDGAVVGEGETPLARIAEHLIQGERFEDLPPIQGLITRNHQKTDIAFKPDQTADLNRLPMPDYQDYFDHLQKLPSAKRFFPVLCAEMSRGCWWQKPAGNKSSRGCAFCNLNLQWHGYRIKRPEKIVAEVDDLTTTYRTLDVAFVDNVLPPKTADVIFKQMRGLKKDLNLFAEVRAGVQTGTLRAMHAAGVEELQIGIEALSTRMLKKLNKGATCLDNIEMMKNCAELGIVNNANLITHFPGSDADDVRETLRVLEFVRPFKPLKTVQFWLGRGSPVSNHPRAYGIQAVFNHPNYARLFPQQIARNVRHMVLGYRGDVTLQHKLWRPVIQAVKSWQQGYAKLRASHGSKPLLQFQDGRDFLIISHRRSTDLMDTHRLTGASRRIYLFCRQQRSLPAICRAFPEFNATGIRSFLKEMVSKKLLFSEDGRYLSLAVKCRPE